MTPKPRVAALVRLATVAAGLALLVSLAVRPALGPAEVRAMGPLPPCRYDDILTSPRQYADWSKILVDTILRVPKGHVPPDLVPASQAGIGGMGKVRAVMIDDLREMSLAAKAANAGIAVHSAYRSYETQQTVFNHYVAIYGRTKALQVSARPGHSEHQLGLAIDFKSVGGGSTLQGSWALTAAGKWMKAHGWEYGFVMSYPKGKIALVCYSFEPWHWRYVGREMAAKIHASGLTPREYLWAHYTTTVVPPPPPKPATTAAPTRAPTHAPTHAPTAPPAPPSVAPSPKATVATPLSSTAPSPAPAATASGAAAGPSAGPTVAPVEQQPVANSEPAVLAGAGLAIGTIVLGGVWFVFRRVRGLG
jgi:D-alanyl-D-alanine carboxypeptidase